MEATEFSLRLILDEGYRMRADFLEEGVETLLMDEPLPLGDGAGPNAARVLAAAVANCLSASLLYCLRRSRAQVGELVAHVTGRLVRNERGRLRVGGIAVRIETEIPPEDQAKLDRCLGLFEDFCVVSASVRQGIEVDVEVDVRTPGPAAPKDPPEGRPVQTIG